MMFPRSSTTIAVALSLFSTIHVKACGDDHTHAHMHKRLPSSAPITPPTRPLEWGDINIIHTTDSHGWLLGHQKTSFPEPNYSGDFGDFASFVSHMKQIAKERGVDLLLVDSGDLHDGTGLSDGGPPGSIDAHETNKFIAQLPYDIMAIGNHELYVYANALDMATNFAPKLNGKYLTSNVNITVADNNNQPVSVPIGSRFRKFQTEMGRSVTALGVLFDFTGNDHNTTVQHVEAMVKEPWFLEAIKDEPDLFLLAGHMPISKDKWPFVFDAIRAVHPTTPIIILGGHTHIRDCNQPDGRSMALESGRYMETVGWMSMSFDSGSSKNLTFSRRYLDPNRLTYEFHTSQKDNTFDTQAGKEITKELLDLAARFNISDEYGVAPHDFTLSQAPYPSENSLLSLFIEKATPIALSLNNTRANIPRLVITNSGGLRFDIYAGPFTKNDQLTASPFTDAFLYVPGVPAGIANQVPVALNKQGAAKRGVGTLEAGQREAYARGYVDMRFNKWLEEMDKRDFGLEKRKSGNLTLGYVTSDHCPGIGDDTVHAPLPFYSSPDFIASSPPKVSDDAAIDLVFVDFIETQLLGILNTLQTSTKYTTVDVQSYSPYLMNQVLGIFAKQAWSTN